MLTAARAAIASNREFDSHGESPSMNAAAAPFSLPPLPWAENALDPVISSRTIGLHYGKHHRTYVTKLNELVAGTPMAGMPLEKVILESAGGKNQKVFNNAAQT